MLPGRSPPGAPAPARRITTTPPFRGTADRAAGSRSPGCVRPSREIRSPAEPPRSLQRMPGSACRSPHRGWRCELPCRLRHGRRAAAGGAAGRAFRTGHRSDRRRRGRCRARSGRPARERSDRVRGAAATAPAAGVGATSGPAPAAAASPRERRRLGHAASGCAPAPARRRRPAGRRPCRGRRPAARTAIR